MNFLFNLIKNEKIIELLDEKSMIFHFFHSFSKEKSKRRFDLLLKII